MLYTEKFIISSIISDKKQITLKENYKIEISVLVCFNYSFIYYRFKRL